MTTNSSLFSARCEECAKPLTDAERERGETFCAECWSVPEEESATPEDRRDLRQILKAWALGDADQMNAVMLSAFLRQFGKAPDAEGDTHA